MRYLLQQDLIFCLILAIAIGKKLIFLYWVSRIEKQKWSNKLKDQATRNTFSNFRLVELYRSRVKSSIEWFICILVAFLTCTTIRNLFKILIFDHLVRVTLYLPTIYGLHSRCCDYIITAYDLNLKYII